MQHAKIDNINKHRSTFLKDSSFTYYMQEIGLVHDFMNRSKFNLLVLLHFIVNIQYIEISYNSGNKTVLYLILYNY